MWVVSCMFLIKRWPKIRFYLMMFSTVVPFVAFLALGTMKTDTNKWTKWVIYQGQLYVSLSRTVLSRRLGLTSLRFRLFSAAPSPSLPLPVSKAIWLASFSLQHAQ